MLSRHSSQTLFCFSQKPGTTTPPQLGLAYTGCLEKRRSQKSTSRPGSATSPRSSSISTSRAPSSQKPSSPSPAATTPEPLTLAAARKLYTYENFLGFLDGLQSRHRAPPHPRRLRTHHLQHDPRPRRPGRRPCRGVHLLRHHLFLEKDRGRTLRRRHRARPASAPNRNSAPPSSGSSTLSATSAPKKPPASSARPPNSAPSIPPSSASASAETKPAAPLRSSKTIYAEASAAGLRLTAHAGESGGPIDGPASIWAAINIGAERIGHGLAAQHDPELLDVLAEKQIPIEINVTSNIRTGCCPSFDDHPIRDYFDSGLMITLNSDDPPMFGANLLDEYILAQATLRLLPRPDARTRRQRCRSQFPPADTETGPPRPHRTVPVR